jgi:hypothetical protein
VPASGTDALGIRVTATNTYGMIAIETFSLAYAPSGSTAPSAIFTNASSASELITLRG